MEMIKEHFEYINAFYIIKCSSADLCRICILSYAVGCIRNKVSQFAKSLYDSMHGLGTNDLSLIRTVVSRCEIDMVQIKQEFERAYKQPLGKFIAVSSYVYYLFFHVSLSL